MFDLFSRHTSLYSNEQRREITAIANLVTLPFYYSKSQTLYFKGKGFNFTFLGKLKTILNGEKTANRK